MYTSFIFHKTALSRREVNNYSITEFTKKIIGDSRTSRGHCGQRDIFTHLDLSPHKDWHMKRGTKFGQIESLSIKLKEL